jgi:Transposase DDE domain
MDRELWRIVLDSIKRCAKRLPRPTRRPTYADWLIAAIYLWCVWHERPLCWGCCGDRAHYGGLFRPRQLPSVSQFTRRVKSDRCQRLLQLVHDELSGRSDVPARLLYVDGKALLVSPVSKDRDARRGRVSGGFAKGYKLHAIVTAVERLIVAWSVMPLNVAEQSVALELVDHLPPLLPDALTLGDSNYDSAPLHKRLAAAGAGEAGEAAGCVLLTPLKGQGRVGPQGHGAQTLRAMGPRRRAALELWGRDPALAWSVLAHRLEVERTFGVLCSFAGGLNGLPPWVRGLARVRRWVGAKIILYHARLRAQRRLAA